MDISELLNSSIGQSVIKNVADELEMNENEASGAVKTAIPTILAGMAKNAQTAKGAESLNKAIESKHDGSLLDNLSGAFKNNSKELQDDGDGILRHVFGNNRSVIEQGISKKTGVSTNKITPLLSTLAPIVMAYIGKEKKQTNTGSSGLEGLLNGLMSGSSKSKSGGGVMNLITGVLDKDGDGDIVDDIMGMFNKRK